MSDASKRRDSAIALSTLRSPSSGTGAVAVAVPGGSGGDIDYVPRRMDDTDYVEDSAAVDDVHLVQSTLVRIRLIVQIAILMLAVLANVNQKG